MDVVEFLSLWKFSKCTFSKYVKEAGIFLMYTLTLLLKLTPRCCCYCGFLLYFEIRSCDISKIVLYTYNCLSNQYFCFHMNYGNWVALCECLWRMSCYWNFDRDCTGSVDYFEKHNYLYNIEYATRWVWEVFPSSVSLFSI